MRKVFTVGLLSVALLVLAGSGAFACDPAKCNVPCDVKTSKTSGTDAKMINSGGLCAPEDKTACAARLGIPVEDCESLCKSGALTLVNLSIKGMTCGGCENTLTTALNEVPGVIKVGSISHEAGEASVYLDSRKGTSEAMVKAITDKGYKADIIPAVVKTNTANENTGKTCSVFDKSSCAAKTKSAETQKASAEGTR